MFIFFTAPSGLSHMKHLRGISGWFCQDFCYDFVKTCIFYSVTKQSQVETKLHLFDSVVWRAISDTARH